MTTRGARRTAAFASKTAIITGGASGIGRAIGAELFGHGARVVLADVDGAAAEIAAKEIAGGAQSASGSIEGMQLDVRDAPAVRSLVEDLARRDGRLDLMFNNAGITLGGYSHEIDIDYWDRVMDVNYRGVVNGVVAAYPLMVAQGHGHIVNTASMAGLAPAVFVAAYSASKHAVVGLSTALRPEAARRGVHVSVVCPGAVDTPILDNGPPADLAPRDGWTMTGRDYMAKAGFTPMPADQFASRALRQVARNKAIIVVPGKAKAMWYFQRISPGAVDRVGRMMARRLPGAEGR
jgi:NAD(P)-dependent dehydrogenase (short-subunit alcohol dehydrogenase family)